ncbi:sensor histidine kinase [Tissierella creatinophila]|uniref:Histidine kinase-, DNA gyrase B-, and HSP90-like ATPase n=1 Tax=Tissierella creatinophila DSM 6911 TaxID=1123403 RepID=A0A1U7M4F8_TISCR|nr:sensor histidine kinase [Tissierella creatinophila]OLS02078.1 histidine kinase-, DNA gyrase B-, and HSP90-like ATPase [Tissierella creatinophila DSM 6911]
MTLNTYDFAYLISNMFSTYIICKFMAIFFDRSKVNKRIEFLSYSIYFIIVSLIYLTVNIPIVNLVVNIILFFALTFNYKSSMKNRIFSLIFIYLTLMVIESIVAVILVHGYKSISSVNSRNTSIIGMISVNIISYIFVLLIGNYNDMKRGINIPNIYWISICFIPLGSLYIIIAFLQEFDYNAYSIIASMLILFTINIFVFHLYNVLNKVFEQMIERTILKEQNKYYKDQLEIMDTNNKNAKSFNHDLRNHLSIIRGYIQIEECQKACMYIDEMIKNNYTIKTIKEFSNSGNIDIDNILNYKLYEASKKDICVSLEIKIPSDINISSFDIVVILGNLLDNAIEATSKVENNKKIDIIIIYEKEIIFINIKNTFNGSILYEKGKILTSKKDRKSHGIGLSNVKSILKKYNGIMDIDYTDNEFCIDIILHTN